VRTACSFAPVAGFGRAAFAIALVAEPIVAFALRKAGPAAGPALAAAEGIGLAAIAGYALFSLVDRRFATGGTFAATVAEFVEFLPSFTLALAPREQRAVPLVPQTNNAWLALASAADPGMLPVVVRRMGSAEDLAAEMQRAAHRSAESAVLATYSRYPAPFVLEPFAADAPPVEAELVPEPCHAAVETRAVAVEARREAGTVQIAARHTDFRRRPSIHLQIGPALGVTRA
jgi:hypothetical protein